MLIEVSLTFELSFGKSPKRRSLLKDSQRFFLELNTKKTTFFKPLIKLFKKKQERLVQGYSRQIVAEKYFIPTVVVQIIMNNLGYLKKDNLTLISEVTKVSIKQSSDKNYHAWNVLYQLWEVALLGKTRGDLLKQGLLVLKQECHSNEKLRKYGGVNAKIQTLLSHPLLLKDQSKFSKEKLSLSQIMCKKTHTYNYDYSSTIFLLFQQNMRKYNIDITGICESSSSYFFTL